MNKENKKKFYLALWIVTGILLGILVGGIIELVYLNLGNTTTKMFVMVYGWTIIFGIIFGLWAGPKAWQKIYVEGARGKKYVC